MIVRFQRLCTTYGRHGNGARLGLLGVPICWAAATWVYLNFPTLEVDLVELWTRCPVPTWLAYMLRHLEARSAVRLVPWAAIHALGFLDGQPNPKQADAIRAALPREVVVGLVLVAQRQMVHAIV